MVDKDIVSHQPLLLEEKRNKWSDNVCKKYTHTQRNAYMKREQILRSIQTVVSGTVKYEKSL